MVEAAAPWSQLDNRYQLLVPSSIFDDCELLDDGQRSNLVAVRPLEPFRLWHIGERDGLYSSTAGE